MKLNRKSSAHILALAAASALLLIAGCRQDMQDEPKMFPQRGTTMFADGRSVRPQVEHTVARGQLDQDQYFYTGLIDGKEQNMMPYPVTLEVLERGQERFNIYCTPCHSRVGNGDGMIVERGYKPAGNFHDPKRMGEPLSHYFFVITNGYGAMPDYSSEIKPVDRWAIAAYIRALQLSQDATMADVPAGVQVQNLKDIAEKDGLPASYAGPWPIAVDTDANALPKAGIYAGAPGEAAASSQSQRDKASETNAAAGKTAASH